MSLIVRVGLVFSFFCMSSWGYAQSTGNSPYSQLGIGDINNAAFVPNQAMGGAGASHANGIYINHINPALLVRNRITIFDVGVNGQLKRLQTNTSSQQDFGGNLGYLAYAFPAAKKWTIGAALRPYSNVNYEINASGPVPGSAASQASYIYKGEGGLTSVELTNAVNIIGGLSLGIRASYIFGNITNESVSSVQSPSINTNKLAYVRRTNYSDFIFNTGLVYRHKLREKLFINGGLVYDFGTKVGGTRFIGFQQRNASDDSPLQVGYDTVARDIKGSVSLPAQYKIGISLDAPFHWAILADFSYQNWSDYKDFNTPETLGSGYTFALGGEWTPDINSVSSFLKRITYRTGLHYTQTPILLNSEQISDFGINFGTSVPVGRGFSTLNLALTAGQRGTLNNNLIKEQYFRVAVGFTLNGLYDRWFQKNKID
jgi:long-subunit fatty acid transport protein